jgi:hypothetical protein
VSRFAGGNAIVLGERGGDESGPGDRLYEAAIACEEGPVAISLTHLERNRLCNGGLNAEAVAKGVDERRRTADPSR